MKRPLSLIEVVIALGLTAILLASLFSCYRHLILSKAHIEKTRAEIFPQLLTQARLTQIFDQIPMGYPLYTDDGAIHLTFDNGIDRDPDYCGLQRVYLSVEEGGMILSYKDKKRREVLQPGVKKMCFSFYDPSQSSWVDHWRGSTLPLQVALHLDSQTYTMRLPKAQYRAVYP